LFGSRSGKNSDSHSPPAAGWYEDPNAPEQLRYWDGLQWTKQVMHHSGLETEVDQTLKKKAQQLETQHHVSVQQEAFAQVHEEHSAKMNDLVNQARKYAQEGKIVKEESRISQFLLHSKNHGGKKELDGAQKFVDGMVARGEIRIGCRLIGDVKNESGLSQYARLNSISSVQTGGASAKIYSDRILHGGQAHAIDAFTGAQVTLDGITQITQRPTLTRMAILSPLPGTALIPGLALQKKTKNDMRTATFIAASADWSLTITVSPDNMSGPRRIAEQINKIAQSMELALTVNNTPIHVAPAPLEATSKIEELQGLRALFQDGVINQAEFDQLKKEIVTRGENAK